MRIWQFMEVTVGGPAVWTWRVLGPAGNFEDVSEPHRNYGSAVTDAIKHGFLPSNEHWVVTTAAGVTRFEPAGSAREHSGLERTQPPAASTDGKGTDSQEGKETQMVKNAGTNGAHLSAAEADIQREYPAATIKWDTATSPYMVSVQVDGALARGFIEPEALAERGELYEAFTRRLSELLTDAMTNRPSGNGSEDLAKTGVRAPLSAAKARSSRS